MAAVYEDPTSSVAERVSDLLGRMTIEEKVAQLGSVWITQLGSDDHFDEVAAGRLLADGIGQITRIGASTGLKPEESAAVFDEVQRFAIDRTRLGVPVLVHEEAVGGF